MRRMGGPRPEIHREAVRLPGNKDPPLETVVTSSKPAPRSNEAATLERKPRAADRHERAIPREPVEHLGKVAGPVWAARDVAGLVLGRPPDIDDEPRVRPAPSEPRGELVDGQQKPALTGRPPRCQAANPPST